MSPIRYAILAAVSSKSQAAPEKQSLITQQTRARLQSVADVLAIVLYPAGPGAGSQRGAAKNH